MYGLKLLKMNTYIEPLIQLNSKLIHKPSWFMIHSSARWRIKCSIKRDTQSNQSTAFFPVPEGRVPPSTDLHDEDKCQLSVPPSIRPKLEHILHRRADLRDSRLIDGPNYSVDEFKFSKLMELLPASEGCWGLRQFLWMDGGVVFDSLLKIILFLNLFWFQL